MDKKAPLTRRGFFGKGLAAALALGGFAVPVATLAKRDLDNEYYMKVIYDRNGRPVKVCYYDRFGSLMYCDPI